MSLKLSFASVLRAMRSTRNLSQRGFGEVTSRTYLSKLETGKSSVTLDKLDQLSQHLELSPLTLLTLTLSESTGHPTEKLIARLRSELTALHQSGGLFGLRAIVPENHATEPHPSPVPGQRTSRRPALAAFQTELAFEDS